MLNEMNVLSLPGTADFSGMDIQCETPGFDLHNEYKAGNSPEPGIRKGCRHGKSWP